MKRLGGVLILLGGLLLGLALGALILLTSGRFGEQTERLLPPTVGAEAADFTLPALAGGQKTLSGWQGQAVVINFWATWCPPCREEMPLLEAAAERYGDRLVIVGVNYAEDAALVQEYIASQNITFPILLDQDGLVSDRYFVRSYPMTFFVDAQGVLRAQHMGLLNAEELDRYLTTIGLESTN